MVQAQQDSKGSGESEGSSQEGDSAERIIQSILPGLLGSGAKSSSGGGRPVGSSGERISLASTGSQGNSESGESGDRSAESNSQETKLAAGKVPKPKTTPSPPPAPPCDKEDQSAPREQVPVVLPPVVRPAPPSGGKSGGSPQSPIRWPQGGQRPASGSGSGSAVSAESNESGDESTGSAGSDESVDASVEGGSRGGLSGHGGLVGIAQSLVRNALGGASGCGGDQNESDVGVVTPLLVWPIMGSHYLPAQQDSKGSGESEGSSQEGDSAERIIQSILPGLLGSGAKSSSGGGRPVGSSGERISLASTGSQGNSESGESGDRSAESNSQETPAPKPKKPRPVLTKEQKLAKKLAKLAAGKVLKPKTTPSPPPAPPCDKEDQSAPREQVPVVLPPVVRPAPPSGGPQSPIRWPQGGQGPASGPDSGSAVSAESNESGDESTGSAGSDESVDGSVEGGSRGGLSDRGGSVGSARSSQRDARGGAAGYGDKHDETDFGIVTTLFVCSVMGFLHPKDENKVALPPAVFYDEKRRLPLPEEDDDDENEVALPPAVFYDEKRRLPLPKDDDDDENKVALPPAVFYDEKRRLPLPAEDEDDENKVALPPAVFYDEKRRLPLPAEDDDDENKVAFPPAVFYDEKPDFQFRRTTTTTNTDIQKKKMMTTRTNRTVGEVPQLFSMGRSQSFWLGVLVGLVLAYVLMAVHVLKIASTPTQVHILSHVGRSNHLINKYGDEDEALASPDDTFQEEEIVAVRAPVGERVAKLEKRVRHILRENQRLRKVWAFSSRTWVTWWNLPAKFWIRK
ncbi:hypothetical protein C0Q70_03255 [Pomacea canaliculata]|uniref:Uncharacterized protein n=1 Tax=Pomacea canaliculata TaxID=400727 RepID=A0A2T7PSB4_POMCA|nr:hypothetical protein C0Q70_03255 [Pomacea canaliculata]